jgi:hypothetical protein
MASVSPPRREGVVVEIPAGNFSLSGYDLSEASGLLHFRMAEFALLTSPKTCTLFRR